jgi:hypothetical protein
LEGFRGCILLRIFICTAEGVDVPPHIPQFSDLRLQYHLIKNCIWGYSFAGRENITREDLGVYVINKKRQQSEVMLKSE